MIRIIQITLFTVLFGLHFQLIAQKLSFSTILEAEDSLYVIMSEFTKPQSDSTREILNTRFILSLERTLTMPEAMEYPFNKLKNLVKADSPDGRFRILHWNLQDDERRHHYYGYLLTAGPSGIAWLRLSDYRETMEQPEYQMLQAPQWYGALYYQIIPIKSTDGDILYTLLGWSGTNSAVTRKVIDVLWFDDMNHPVFGKKIFKGYHREEICRVLFTYSATTTISLKFKAPDTIFFDRLVPIDPALEGQFQFYTGSGEAIDGFLVNKGFWEFTPGLTP